MVLLEGILVIPEKLQKIGFQKSRIHHICLAELIL